MFHKYNKIESMVSQMSDDELDFNLALSRLMMRQFAKFSAANGASDDLRNAAIREFKWWYKSWEWTLHEIKRRG